MTIIYTDAHRAHQPAHEIYDGQPVAYPETAARAEVIIRTLREQQVGDIQAPDKFPLSHVYAVHQREYVHFLKRRSQALGSEAILYPSHFMSDTYAPITAGTYSAARAAVDVALTGAQLILKSNSPVYTLCRPPGHHAAHHQMGGYCYFNNTAVAAHYLSAHGTVAILDIDFHHGNGTQEIFYDRDDVAYISIHANPRHRYPYSSGFAKEQGRGPGVGCNFNYPLPLGTSDETYLRALRTALSDVQRFAPDFLIVSAGFDTFAEDPIGGFALTLPVYETIGRCIAELQVPTLIIQEGGYNVEYLGQLAAQFLGGFSRT